LFDQEDSHAIVPKRCSKHCILGADGDRRNLRRSRTAFGWSIR
jgi:hypothetical protein